MLRRSWHFENVPGLRKEKVLEFHIGKSVEFVKGMSLDLVLGGP